MPRGRVAVLDGLIDGLVKVGLSTQVVVVVVAGADVLVRYTLHVTVGQRHLFILFLLGLQEIMGSTLAQHQGLPPSDLTLTCFRTAYACL